MKMHSWVLYALAGVSLFVFTTGLSYLGFSKLGERFRLVNPTPTPGVTIGKKSKVDPALPKTAACPLNGAMYTESERKTWETRRPLAVMIENHIDSRPLSGLSSADVIYEAVVEGGITRLMGIFYCGIAAGDEMLAPVRSARIYFTKLVPEYDALYNHVGGAGRCDDPTVDDRVKALCFIAKNNIKDMDQFGLGFKQCHRLTSRLDREVAYEHTMACYTDQLYSEAAVRGWTNVDSNLKSAPAWNAKFVGWKFKDPSASLGQITDISFDFWASQPNYSVAWKYNPQANSYSRSVAGQIDIDLNTGEQHTTKNLVIQFVRETGPLDEHLHMNYEVIGTGKMILFQDGQMYTGSWTKTTTTTRTKFVLDSGKEIQFNKGMIWIELVPSGNNIVHN